MFILEILARFIVVVKEDAVLLNKDLDARLRTIQIQKYSCVFLLGGTVTQQSRDQHGIHKNVSG